MDILFFFCRYKFGRATSFFLYTEKKAGQWKIFIFGDFSNDFNAYVFFSLDFIGICSYMVTSSIITGMMQISENWPGKSSALHFNDFWFPETFSYFCDSLSYQVLRQRNFLLFERKKSQREKVAEKLRQLHHPSLKLRMASRKDCYP